MSDKDLEELKKFGETVGLSDSQDLDAPYALKIEGIDQQKDRDLVFKVLSESGVDLDLEAVKKQLASGHLLVSHLNEAKAAIIVDQIKEIDADIHFGLLSVLRPKK